MSQNNLNFFLQPFGPMGIPNHSRDFATALIKNLDDVRLTPLFPPPKNRLEATYGMTQDLQDRIGRPNNDYPALMFWYPNTYDQVLGVYPKNIGYYIFEYTKIPKPFIEEINKLDGICTASRWGVDILKKNGVTIPCYVIPGGVDTDKFNSKNREENNSDVFKFLHIGKFENRKGTEMLISAFDKAFSGDTLVRLTLSIDNPHLQGFDSELYIKEKAKNSGNIDVIHFVNDVVDLYNSHDVAVFPTKAEGIGLPIVEAMSCGMPVITSWNSGITEYASDDNAILLRKTKTVPVFDEKFFPEAGFFGTWDSPTEEELVEKLIWAKENYEKAKLIGENAERYIKENYTWDMAAKKYLSEVMK